MKFSNLKAYKKVKALGTILKYTKVGHGSEEAHNFNMYLQPSDDSFILPKADKVFQQLKFIETQDPAA